VLGSVVARDVSKSFGAVPVLAGVSLAVAPGDRIGIVGPNGIGKSTLLRVLAGLETPDVGSVSRSGRVGYMPQEVWAEPGETVLGFLGRRTGVEPAAAEMDALADRLGAEPDLASLHGEALERFLSLGGEDFEARARAMIADVGLTGRGLHRVTSLSGGESARVSLAAILLARFDTFLLDEPTNNLDFEGLERLERFLDGLGAGVVLVSHDRDFLDRTVTRVVELEAETRRVRAYAGAWSDYERARDQARTEHERAYAEYASRRQEIEAQLSERRSQARALGGSRRLARQTGGSDRRATSALRGKVAQAKRQLDQLETVDKPWSPWRLELSFAPAQRTGAIAELRGAVVERGSFHAGPVDLELLFGDRVAIVGANGSGKTTLLRALLGEIPLAAGTRAVGAGTVFGELEQARTRFAGVLLDDFVELSGLSRPRARTLLAKFALGGEDVTRSAPTLSPGERTRAVLALFAARAVNCLILDEPTNHLDLEAIEELERALDSYEGSIVVVSHDRRFLERLVVTRTIRLEATLNEGRGQTSHPRVETGDPDARGRATGGGRAQSR
jgi:ATPase subunit of ABC transporter with duplicated ATPase domains